MKVYVASSWKNVHLDDVVKGLRADGHNVYDFREHGFGWKQAFEEAGFVELKRRGGTEPELKVSAKEWVRATSTPTATKGFKEDFDALKNANKVVLVLPAGRSAHLEAGYAVGIGARVYVYQPELERPDLMVKMIEADGGRVWDNLDDLRLEMFPGSSIDKAIERAARLVEQSGLAPPEARVNLAAVIRARKQSLP